MAEATVQLVRVQGNSCKALGSLRTPAEGEMPLHKACGLFSAFGLEHGSRASVYIRGAGMCVTCPLSQLFSEGSFHGKNQRPF